MKTGVGGMLAAQILPFGGELVLCDLVILLGLLMWMCFAVDEDVFACLDEVETLLYAAIKGASHEDGGR